MGTLFSSIEESLSRDKPVPNNLNECTAVDDVSHALERWAFFVIWGSLGIAIVIFLIGFIVWNNAEEFMAFLPFGICGFIVLAVGDFFPS